MHDRNYIFKILEEYIDEHYYYKYFPNMFKFKKNHEEEWFYQLSYQQWAAYEIMDQLKAEDEDHLVINDLEDLRWMFNEFACKATGYHEKFMFSVAEDVAADMIDIIIGLE